MKTRGLLYLALFIGYIGSAKAENAHNISGVGQTTCIIMNEKVIKDLNYGEVVVAWAEGFISGANLATISNNRRYRDTSGLVYPVVLKNILQACLSKPQSPVIAVVEEIYGSLPLKTWQH